MTAIINPNKRGLKGDTGDAGTNGTNGSNGTAATVAVGTVTTGASGTNASVTNSGTSSAAVLNFTIPRGDAGPSKRIVTARANTDASGNVSFTFSPAFASIPVILPSMSSTNSREYWRITAQSTSSVTIQAFSQNQSFLSILGLDVLTAGTTAISGRSISIVAIEV